MGGRKCGVCMALTQDAARSLAAGAEPQAKDNRHLYLVQTPSCLALPQALRFPAAPPAVGGGQQLHRLLILPCVWAA